MKAKVKGYSDLVTLVGSMLEVPIGTVLLAEWQWKANGKYGQQFQVETYEEVLPATVYGIEKYLGSGLIKGIGPKFARAIVNRFGADTLNIIDNDIQRLHKVPGLRKKHVEKIADSWEMSVNGTAKSIRLQKSHSYTPPKTMKPFNQYFSLSVSIKVNSVDLSICKV